MTTRFPHALLLTLLFNTVIAVLLTGAGFGSSGVSMAGFGKNFVVSQCIGLSMFTLIHIGCRILWPSGPPSKAGMVLLVSGSIVLAWLAGSALADWLSGADSAGASWRGSPAILLITATAGVVTTLFFWSRERLAHSQAQTMETQLRLLQAQIEPHFLFNTLANLDALIASEPARARTMLGHLIDYLRTTLTAARRERHSLGDEFALLRGYLELLAVRMGPRLSFELDLPPALLGEPLPPMLIQPLVENAIKHGLEPKIDGGRIVVRARRVAGALVITVEDNGLGMERSAVSTPGTGIGLKHIRERLQVLYGSGARLTIGEPDSGGVHAALHLPATSVA